MITGREIKNREIINLTNGKSLGFASDININIEKSRIYSLIIPVQKSGLMGILTGYEEKEIKWKDVKVIGEDVILVIVY